MAKSRKNKDTKKQTKSMPQIITIPNDEYLNSDLQTIKDNSRLKQNTVIAREAIHRLANFYKEQPDTINIVLAD